MIILLVQFCAQLGLAQGRTNYLFVQAGIESLSLKDRTFSPTVFSGVVPQVGVGFHQNIRDERLWNARVSASVGTIDYENRYFPSDYTSAQLTFNYLWKAETIGQSKLFVGAQLESVLNVLDYEGFSSGSWFSAQQLEPIVQYTYPIAENQSISGQFSYPILSLVSRPPYAGVDETVVINSDNIPKILYSRTELYSLGKLIDPNLELKYVYRFSKGVFTLAANYNYLQVNSIRKYYRNRLGINATYHLKIGKKDEN